MSTHSPAPLSPSELGTKEYWDTTYTTDLTHHATNPSHTGHTWFTSARATPKILSYLLSPSLALPKPSSTILDLGTGNGEMLFQLRGAGFTGRMVGVDYSKASVEFCRRIAAGRGDVVEFERWDILGDERREEWEGTWDVVLDKGTFDAVCLSGKREEGRYVERVEELVRKGGLVVVTSCNWTEEELGKWWEGGGGLKTVGRVAYPVYSFGGGKGQTVCTMCFRREG